MKVFSLIFVVFAVLFVSLVGAHFTSCPNPAIPNVDLKRYLGIWYELGTSNFAYVLLVMVTSTRKFIEVFVLFRIIMKSINEI
jgi:lipocalin